MSSLQQVTNPYPELIANRLTALGVTGEAANWVVKALHPAGPACPDGIPDADTSSSLRPEYRLSKVISKPTALPGGDWDLILIKHPTDATAFVWAAGPAGVDFTSSDTPGDAEQGVEFNQPFIPVGTVNVTNIAGGESPVVAWDMVQPDSLPAAWRHSSSSITAYLTSSDLYNQGTVYAGQYGHSVQHDNLQYRPFTGVGTPGVTQFIQRSASGSAPYSEQLMTLTTPKLRTAPAKEGAYIPLRLNGPSQPFVEPNHAGSEVILVSGTQVYTPFTSQVAFTPVHVRDYTNRTAANAYGKSWVYGSLGSAVDNVATGIILFRGLHATASITVKTYDQLEIRPRFDSPSRSFVVPAARYNPHAIEAYLMLCHELLDCYPASYNSFGTILSSIGKALLPVARAIVPGAGPIIDAVGGLFTKPREIEEKVIERAPRAEKKKKRAQIAAPVRSRSARRK